MPQTTSKKQTKHFRFATENFECVHVPLIICWLSCASEERFEWISRRYRQNFFNNRNYERE